MYKVTIKREEGKYVARDESGDWRAYGRIDRERKGLDLVRYLFHADEIAGVDASGDSTVAFIFDGSEQ